MTTALNLIRSSIAIMRQEPLGLHQAITRAANLNNAPETVVTAAFEIANVYSELARFQREQAVERLEAMMLEPLPELSREHVLRGIGGSGGN